MRMASSGAFEMEIPQFPLNKYYLQKFIYNSTQILFRILIGLHGGSLVQKCV